MAWTTPRTWNPGETVTASLMNTHLRDNLNYLKATAVATETISRGGGVLNTAAGITAAVDVVTWRAPFSCTVINVRGFRTGGSSADVNARRNQTDEHLSSDLTLGTADAWADGGSVQNTAYVAGDELEIRIKSTTGDPTYIAVQVDLSVP